MNKVACILTIFLFIFTFSANCSITVNTIANVEEKYSIPKGILKAIAKVESKMKPYAVNVSHKTHYFDSKEEAKVFIEKSIKEGRKNISIGCMQLLYGSHRKNFNDSIDDMLDIEKNIEYGGKYLRKLYLKYGSWEKAIKRYHTKIASKANRYYNKVMSKVDV